MNISEAHHFELSFTSNINFFLKRCPKDLGVNRVFQLPHRLNLNTYKNLLNIQMFHMSATVYIYSCNLKM